ncbi:MAG: hypothetical protein AAGK78_00295 [Planctomycetota bacterium]
MPASDPAANPVQYDDPLQQLCETGQQKLIATDYLGAETILMQAEAMASERDDLATLGRLYYPLQEARRQRRQVCGEGVVRLDLWANGPDDAIDPLHVLSHHPHGQLLVAGWASIEPALQVRQAAAEKELFVETYLAAIYPVSETDRVVAVVPSADVALPPADAAASGVDQLQRKLPPHSVVLATSDVPRGTRAGSAETFGYTMNLWESLAAPFLATAKATTDPRRRIAAYRQVIDIDYACEKAHQWLAETALSLARGD